MGLNQQMVSYYESEKIKNPKHSVLNRYIDEFNLDKDFFRDDYQEDKTFTANTKEKTSSLPGTTLKHKDTVDRFSKILSSKNEKEIHMVIAFTNDVFDMLWGSTGKRKNANPIHQKNTPI